MTLPIHGDWNFNLSGVRNLTNSLVIIRHILETVMNEGKLSNTYTISVSPGISFLILSFQSNQ